jgi:hypothetical protein
MKLNSENEGKMKKKFDDQTKLYEDEKDKLMAKTQQSAIREGETDVMPTQNQPVRDIISPFTVADDATNSNDNLHSPNKNTNVT